MASQGLLKHSLLGFSSNYMITYFGGKALICWCYWLLGVVCKAYCPVVDNYDIPHVFIIFFIVHTPLYCSEGTSRLSPVTSCVSFFNWLILLFSDICRSSDFYSPHLRVSYVHFPYVVERKSMLSFRHLFIGVDPFLDRRLTRQQTGGWSTCCRQLF